MKTMLFIYNPRAGKARIRTLLADLVETFDRADFDVTVRPTRTRGDVARFLEAFADKYDRIVVSGGDGTMNEALCGLRDAAKQGKRLPELGFVPSGSTNDFATTLRLPTDPVRAAQIAATGEIFPCDAGTFNGRPFTYVAAFGAFTKASYSTPQQIKNSLGHLAYIFEGLKELPQIKGIPLQIFTDSGRLEGKFLYGMVSNTTSVAGISKIYPDSEVALNDGLLEVLLVKEPRSLAERSELLSDLLRMNLSSRHLILLKTRKITFVPETKLPWTLDGEFGGNTEAAEIAVVPDAFRILIPAKDFEEPPKQKKNEKNPPSPLPKL